MNIKDKRKLCTTWEEYFIMAKATKRLCATGIMNHVLSLIAMDIIGLCGKTNDTMENKGGIERYVGETGSENTHLKHFLYK